MDTRNHSTNVVALDKDGKVTLPSELLKRSRFGIGDLLFVVELSEDTIVLKRLDPNTSAMDMLEELGATLRAAGYDTMEKADRLVDEIKLEVTDEWLKSHGVRQSVSS